MHHLSFVAALLFDPWNPFTFRLRDPDPGKRRIARDVILQHRTHPTSVLIRAFVLHTCLPYVHTALDQDQTALDQGQMTLDQGQTTLDQGQTALDQGQTTLDQGQTVIDQGQKGPRPRPEGPWTKARRALDQGQKGPRPRPEGP